MRKMVLIGLMVVGCGGGVAQAQTPAPQTAQEWLQREHRFLRRYLAVVKQTVHDYAYGYQTPPLLMPIALDLFTGYVAPLHEIEEQFLYPKLQSHMTAEQHEGLRLIMTDQIAERESVKTWTHDLEQYEAGRKKREQLVEPIEYLGRMINRHLVLQEERLFPLMEMLTPKEQAEFLRAAKAFENQEVSSTGHARYEHLLAYIEGEIKLVAGRIW